jgi:hypothetical protein
MIIPRKIISASISGTLLAIILGVIDSNPFGESQPFFSSSYFFDFVSIVPIYMIYILPATLIYGVLASIVSDKLGEFISIKSDEKIAEIIVSGALHVVFGLVLLWYSLGASALFFITDRVIRKGNKSHRWIDALKFLAVPLLLWVIFVGIVWGKDVLT